MIATDTCQLSQPRGSSGRCKVAATASKRSTTSWADFPMPTRSTRAPRDTQKAGRLKAFPPFCSGNISKKQAAHKLGGTENDP